MTNTESSKGWKRVYEKEQMPPEQTWVIDKHLTNDDLSFGLTVVNEEYAGWFVQDTTSEILYYISHFSIMYYGNQREYAVNYHPYDLQSNYADKEILLTRPAREFFDGRYLFFARE